jgi:hypothetical protein
MNAPDEGGMNIRLDPRHLGTLRALASEAGVRPGELVTLWVTERLDAERSGTPSPNAIGPVLESLNERIEALSRRVDALAGTAPADDGAATSTGEPTEPRRRGRPPKASASSSNGASAPRKRGRPSGSSAKRTRGKNPSVPLHEEIAAVLAERGPMSAADLATAVAERGIYAPPRSGKPLDATAVSVRVSNPRYRSRFTRAEGKISLA